MFRKVEGQVAQGSAWMAGISIAELCRALAQLLLVTRMLDLAQFGAFTVIVTTGFLFQGAIAVLGHDAVTTFMARSVAKGRSREAAVIMWSVFKLSALLGLASYGLLVVFAFTGTHWLGLGPTDTAALLVYGTAVVPMSVRESALAVLRLTNHVARGFVVTVAGGLAQVSGLLVVSWAAEGSLVGVAAAVAGGMALVAAGLLVAAVASARQMGLPKGEAGTPLRALPPDVTEFLRGSFWQTKLALLYYQLDVLLLSALATPVQVGLYGVARRLMDFPMSLAHPIAQAVQAECSKRWYGADGEGFRRLVLRLGAVATGIALASCIGLFLLGEQVIVWFDPESADAGAVLMLMIPGLFASVATWGLFLIPLGLGRLRPALTATAAATVVLVATGALLVPDHGAVGAAWARNAAYVTLGAVSVAFAVSLWRQSRRLPAPSPDTRPEGDDPIRPAPSSTLPA